MTKIKALDVQLGNVTEHNLQQLKTINIATLPVRYTDKFYKDLLNDSLPELIKFAFWNGFAVGSLCSRIEAHSQTGYKKLYIMTLSILAAYRRRGIGK